MGNERTYLSHQFSTGNALSTLGAATAILFATRLDAAMLQGIKLRKIKGYLAWSAKTTAEGPLIWGICVGVDAAEVAEALSADPQRGADPGASEQSKRKVFPIGIINRASVSNDQGSAMAPVDGQKMVDWGVPSWSMLEEEALNLFVFNRGSGALTTGTLIEFGMTVVARWLDD